MISLGIARAPRWLATTLIVAIYAATMISTNGKFTVLDDEANSLAIASRSVNDLIGPFLGQYGSRELHPPETEIIWHLWLVLTRHSLFLSRALANFLYVGAILLVGACAERLAGAKANRITLLVGFTWPFAFQYGRIAGWYTLSVFLLSLVTWLYLRILDDRRTLIWIGFALASASLVWSNYFGFVFLFLLFLDLILFHRAFATTQKWQIVLVASVIAATFVPLLTVAASDVSEYISSEVPPVELIHELAAFAYPAFAMLGSAAVAPWFFPLSIPVVAAAMLLLVAILRGIGRRWLIYSLIAMLAMEVARVFDIKRVLIFLPWLFLATSLSSSAVSAPYRHLARYSTMALIVLGWIGILSGQHYATSNLYEPWNRVAQVVASDARSGATVISANPPFFFYLDYALGLQHKMQSADGADLGADLYRQSGYTILEPGSHRSDTFHGKVVLVIGSGMVEDVESLKSLNESLSHRCEALGEYRAAPDPALAFKQHFARWAPALSFRTHVVWYECP